MTNLAWLATIGPPCGSIEMYNRAKNRLYSAMYGKEFDVEAYCIMHKLKKKAFGIFSPFQMEDFLPYPVIHEQKAQEPEKANAYFEEIFAKYRRFTELNDTIIASLGHATTVQGFGSKIREQEVDRRPQIGEFKVQGTGVL